MTAILSTHNLCFCHGNSFTLEGISFEVSAGELFGITGPNGCGKTTLLRLLCGELEPMAGGTLCRGLDPRTMPARERARLLALLPAETTPPPQMSALELAVMGRSPHLPWWRDYGGADYHAAQQALDMVGLGHAAQQTLSSLSSGERRKAFIAQALCQRAPALLLDEPTAHLDLKCQIETFGLMRALAKKSGAAVIVVSHDISLVARYCDRVLLLCGGRQAALGAPQAAITPEKIKTVYGLAAETAVDSAGNRHLLFNACDGSCEKPFHSSCPDGN